ncbi:MAG: hypothetical protein FD177_2187 [Desulfovibrionaceae bacterium]|nr:MAG: hypothetical protein FD177_2187 [Desulfovibrionaceae bacterium]
MSSLRRSSCSANVSNMELPRLGATCLICACTITSSPTRSWSRSSFSAETRRLEVPSDPFFCSCFCLTRLCSARAVSTDFSGSMPASVRIAPSRFCPLSARLMPSGVMSPRSMRISPSFLSSTSPEVSTVLMEKSHSSSTKMNTSRMAFSVASEVSSTSHQIWQFWGSSSRRGGMSSTWAKTKV